MSARAIKCLTQLKAKENFSVSSAKRTKMLSRKWIIIIYHHHLACRVDRSDCVRCSATVTRSIAAVFTQQTSDLMLFAAVRNVCLAFVGCMRSPSSFDAAHSRTCRRWHSQNLEFFYATWAATRNPGVTFPFTRCHFLRFLGWIPPATHIHILFGKFVPFRRMNFERKILSHQKMTY